MSNWKASKNINKMFAVILACGAACFLGVLVLCMINYLIQPRKCIPHFRPHLDLKFSNPHLTFSAIKAQEAAVVVVTDYNQSAGFGWLIFNALNTAHMCEVIGPSARPVVFFTKGYYMETRPQYIRAHAAELSHPWDRNNWFNNFFEPIEPEGWRPYLLRHFSREVKAASARTTSGPGVWQFDRASLNSLAGGKRDFQALWKKYFRPRPHIVFRLQELEASIFEKGVYVYGVHYRGTDKYGHGGVKGRGGVVRFCTEDEPEHMDYSWVFERLRREIQKNSGRGVHGSNPGVDFRILCASDEAPFVEAALHEFGAGVAFSKPETIRSSISTSGLSMDTRLCGSRPSLRPECQKLQELVEASVHRGHRELSKYHKGEDVLLETLLLSKTDTFLKSRGNFSNLALYMARNPRQIVIDMASEWRGERPDRIT